MKVKIPAKEIEVCDNCQGGGYLDTCVVCKGKYCLTCGARGMSGCEVSPPVCRKCSEDSRVLTIVIEKYAPQILAVVKRRDAALKRLGCQAKNNT